MHVLYPSIYKTLTFIKAKVLLGIPVTIKSPDFIFLIPIAKTKKESGHQDECGTVHGVCKDKSWLV